MDRGVPIRSDWHTLEDGAERLGRTVAKDEDANAPQGNYKRPADGKDATIEEKDGEFDAALENI